MLFRSKGGYSPCNSANEAITFRLEWITGINISIGHLTYFHSRKKYVRNFDYKYSKISQEMYAKQLASLLDPMVDVTEGTVFSLRFIDLPYLQNRPNRFVVIVLRPC